MQLLQDRVALITGAGHGQGRSHAVRLAQEGADVVLIDSCGPAPAGVAYPLATEDELAETADLVRAAGRRALIRTADVRDFDQLAAAVSDSLNEFGRLDVVVANAGIISYNLTWEIPEPAWDTVIDTNLKGVWNTFRATVPAMIEQQTGGSIIAVSSVAGLKGYALMSHYTASKFAVVGMVKVLALELAEHGISREHGQSHRCRRRPEHRLGCRQLHDHEGRRSGRHLCDLSPPDVGGGDPAATPKRHGMARCTSCRSSSRSTSRTPCSGSLRTSRATSLASTSPSTAAP